jgi:PTH1 family peptidyl-tRNA hydrolase
MIKLFVGLGNPGPEYEGTRHNAGFLCADQFARKMQLALAMDRAYCAELGRIVVNGQPVWMLKPQTFMNLSGRSVAALAKYFKIEPHQILVLHDELDLEPGDAKLKFGGNHAGHNGLRSIHAELGTAEYWRLRLGVGHPGVKAEVVNWVLKKPILDDRIAIEQSIDRALKALPSLLAGEMEKAKLIIHTNKPPRPKSPMEGLPLKKIE